MTHLRNPFSAYRNAVESTVSKPRIVQMLLDGAVTSIQNAIEAFEVEDVGVRLQTIHNQTAKAGAIVAQLRDALDLDSGGELASRLAGLYVYIGNLLMRGNIRKDSSMLEEAKRHLEVIQDSWREMLAKTSPHALAPARAAIQGEKSDLSPAAAGFSIKV
jgi:flagellar protein FliS